MNLPKWDHSNNKERKGAEPSSCSSLYPILNPDLLQHYINNGLDEIEAFLYSKAHHDQPSCTENTLINTGSRFIRLNPRYDAIETLNLLVAEKMTPIEVTWLGRKMGFYAIPADFSLHRSQCFNSGRIYGMDVSSGAAVAALLLDDYDCMKSDDKDIRDQDRPFRVIDLCCAPGLKLCAIADLLSSLSFHPQCKNTDLSLDLVGVDICPQRLSLCKNIISKYHIHSDTRGDLSEGRTVNIRLFCADSTTLANGSLPLNPSSLVFDSNIALDESSHAGKRKRMNKSARTRERKRLREIFLTGNPTENLHESISTPLTQNITDTPTVQPWLDSFDRVLVDAECSTDGAIFHMAHKCQSMHDSSYTTLTNEKLSDPNKLRDLVQLQQNLILSGFQLLRPGGILVYSTCSLSTEQNEGIISWLIRQFQTSAFIIPVAFNQADRSRVEEGAMAGTVRFRPNVKTRDDTLERDTYGGGFFIAKIGKKS